MEFGNMDKYEHLTAATKKGSFIKCYQDTIIEFGTNQIQQCNSKKDLNYYSGEYSELLQKISDLSIEYFNDIGKNDNAEKALMTANTYISRITTIYLNQINQKINKLDTKTNIRLAYISVIGAIISIGFAIVFQIWQNCSGQEQKNDIKEIKTNINALKQHN